MAYKTCPACGRLQPMDVFTTHTTEGNGVATVYAAVNDVEYQLHVEVCQG